MSYPKKEIINDWGIVVFVEMTPEEYEKELKNFKDLSEKFLSSSNRRNIEYGEYLDSLENNEECFDCYSDEINQLLFFEF